MSWDQSILSELILPGKGALVSGPFGSNIGSRFFVDEGIPVIRGNNLTKGTEKFRDEGFVFLTETKAAEFPNCIALEDDIVFTAAGSIGQVGIIPKDRKFDWYIISNKQIRARLDKSRANPLFVYYWLSSRTMVKYIESQNNGGAVPLLNLGLIRKLPVPLPPLEIQKRIAAILSTYDDLVENNRRRIGLLEDAARQLYKEWFTRLRFPGHEHVKMTDGVPEGWERKTIREVATLNYGKALKDDTRIPGDVPVYGSSGIVGTHNKALVTGPGIILGRKGNVGSVRWSHSDFFPIDTVYFIASDQSDFHLYLTLQHMQFMSTDVAVPGLNRDFAYSRLLLRPSAKIAGRFEEEVAPIFFQIQKLISWNSKLAKARDLLLPRLMNGRLAA